jgi:uncharacterized protein YbbC (DUF1343 family)
MNAVYLYPSTCFFEGTVISEGRGTEAPFEVFGHPDLKGMEYEFIPRSIPGKATRPKLEGERCYGMDLTGLRQQAVPEPGIRLEWLIAAYRNFPEKDGFFIPYFENLSGTATLREQIVAGLSEEEIRASWRKDLEAFMKIRKKYLIYPG